MPTANDNLPSTKCPHDASLTAATLTTAAADAGNGASTRYWGRWRRRRPERRRRFLVSSFLDESHRLFHFSRATMTVATTLATTPARWTVTTACATTTASSARGRCWMMMMRRGLQVQGKHSHRTAAINAKDISMVIQNDRLFIVFSFYTL